MSVRPVAIDGPSSYTAFLDEAWQQHLAPRAADAPTVISLFAGCGGSSLGYSMAGYREVLAVERDPLACATFRLNFPDVPLYAGNIEDLTAEACLAQSGLVPGQLDVLDGSPPCQGFSTAGKRQMADARNYLFREYIRLLEGLQPKAFVIENVSGMVKGKMKLVFADMIRALKACGYKVSARRMNAMYFRVPQSRERLIFVGSHDGDTSPSHPQAQCRPIVVQQALHGISAMNYVPYTGWGLKAWNLLHPGEALSKYHVEFSSRGSGHGHMKIHPAKVCSTITKSPTFTRTGKMHWSEPRSLSIEEIKALSSFPASFRFVGSFDEQWACIGNAVPPLFMRAIAQHVRMMLDTACPLAVAD